MDKTKKPQTNTSEPRQQGRTAITRRYRKWYSSLPAGVQMVGLQLWLPLFFTLMFCFCYIFAFHQPKIQNVPVGYVDATSQAAVMAGRLEKSFKGVLDVKVYADADAAVAATRHGEIAAALQPGREQDVLYVASAHQYQAATLARQMLQPYAQAQGKAVKVDDLAPLPSHDLFGTVPLYMMLVTCIGGYMVGMFLGMMGGPLKHRTRIAMLLGSSFVLSLVAQLIIGPVLGAEQGHFWQLWPLAWAWMFAIGLVVNGLGYFVGRFIAAFALTIFVFLSMPSSSGAYPAYFMPEPFRWLNHIVVGSGITEMFKHILYGVGPGLSRGYTILAGYLVAGVILTFLGKPYWERKRANNILAGRTTMFMDAQRANTAHGQEVRRQIFKDAGLELPEEAEKKGTPDEPDCDEFDDQSPLGQMARTGLLTAFLNDYTHVQRKSRLMRKPAVEISAILDDALLYVALEARPSPVRLGHLMNVTPATATGYINALGKNGYLRRMPEADGGPDGLQLTDKGLDAYHKILRNKYDAVSEFMEPLSDEDLRALVKVLDKMHRGLMVQSAPGAQ